jgi:hypothetical protein
MKTLFLFKSVRQSAEVARKMGTLFLVFATIIWAMGAPVGMLLPQEANAAVTLATAPADISGFQTVSSNSGVPVFDFVLTASASETLNALKITIASVSGAENSDFQGCQIQQDTNNPGSDVFDQNDTSWFFPCTVGLNTLTLNPVATLPTSMTSRGSKEFRVMVGTTAGISNGDQFTVSLAAGTTAFTLSSGTVTNSAFTSRTITADKMPPSPISWGTAGAGSPFENQEGVALTAPVWRAFTSGPSGGNEIFAVERLSVNGLLLQAHTPNTQVGTPTGSNLCASVGVNNNQVICNHAAFLNDQWYTMKFLGSGAEVIRDSAFNFLPAEVKWSFKTVSAGGGGGGVLFTVSNTGPAMNPGSSLPLNSFEIPVIRLGLTGSEAGQTFTSLGVSFAGTGFTSSDLAALGTGSSSGVSVYSDTNNNGFFDPGTDLVNTLASAPTWSGTGPYTATLSFATPISLTSGTQKFFFLAIRTSGTGSNGDQIIATIPINGAVTTGGNGPAGAAFSANYLQIDSAPPQITEIRAVAGSSQVEVLFNRPVQKYSTGGNLVLADSPFTYVDGGGTAQTIAAISHTAGQSRAVLTMSGNLDAEDVDGTPATLAAGTNKIATMSDAFLTLSTAPVTFSSPLSFTTQSIPAATAGATYTNVSPLVTLAVSGGVPSYTFAPNSTGPAPSDEATLTSTLGLALVASGVNAGKITGTIPTTVSGAFSVNLKVTDSAAPTVSVTRMFTINVIPQGGGNPPGITSVTPAGAAQGATSIAVTITGSNTSFSAATSNVQFILNGAPDTNITVSSKTSTGLTNLSFNITVAALAAAGSRTVRVTTGAQVVEMPYGFGIYAAGGSGLGLLYPTNGATSVPIPPAFNFSPTSNTTVNSYRITVASTSNMAEASKTWDYAFPKTGNTHCDASTCNTPYGSGMYLLLTPPTPPSSGTTYYWQVRTYTNPPGPSLTTDTALESTAIYSFTTTSSATDTIPPSIMHRSVFRATASTDLQLHAKIMDNILPPGSSSLTAKIFYCQGASCNPTTEGAAPTYLGNGFYRFVIPSATIGVADTVVRYYLQAFDGTNTANFKGPGDVPFQLISVAAGATSISGTVKDSTGACPTTVQGATVFTDGAGFSATTNGTCAYTLSGLPAGIYDVMAFKTSQGEGRRDGISAGSTSIEIRLSAGGSGGCGAGCSGGSGDFARPFVKFTGPPAGGIAPSNDSNFKIFVGFSKAMSGTSVTTLGNLTVNELNPQTGALTAITSNGSWAYYPTASGVQGVPQENYVAVWSFSGTNTFGDNKTIVVVIFSSVTDTSGQAIQSNNPDNSFTFSFNTGQAVASSAGNFSTFIAGGGGGQFTPPYVTGSNPSNGAKNIPTNTKIIVNFSQPMDSTGIEATNSTGTYVKLYDTNVGGSGQYVTLSSVALDPSTRQFATLTPASALTASHSSYAIRVLGGAKAANGMTMAAPDQINRVMYQADFSTGAGSETGAPTVLGNSLQMYTSVSPCTGANVCVSGVPTNVGFIGVGLSKDMDASTVNSSNITLAAGSSSALVNINYDNLTRSVKIMPANILSTGVTYTLTLGTGIKALNGTALAAAYVISFSTSAAIDSTGPTVTSGQADDTNLSVSFSEPMQAATATDTANWSSSVLNPANYVLYTDDGPPPGGSTALYFSNNTLATATTAATGGPLTFSYDPAYNSVKIKGLQLMAGAVKGGFRVWAQNVKDLSGNVIQDTAKPANASDFGANSTGGGVMNSSTTFGMIGPGQGGMSGPPPTAALTGGEVGVTAFGGKNPAMMGFKPTQVFPVNMLAGQESLYLADVLLIQAYPASSQIVLTFPVGFDVTNAVNGDPNRLTWGRDLNGPGTGAPVIASVTANAVARTVTIVLGAATGTQANDFLHLEIDRIKNSTIPNDMASGGSLGAGYQVSIEAKLPVASGSRTVETFSSMPFFIRAGGAATNTLTGTITFKNAAGANTAVTTTNLPIYLMSPLTGPLKQLVSLTAEATKTYTFSGLSPGQYMVGTEPVWSIGATDYYTSLQPLPRQIQINAGANTLNIDFQAQSIDNKPRVTFNITGIFTSNAVDIFYGGPGGFGVKTVTLDGTYTALSPYTTTLYLPSAGTYSVGMGPAMPRGPQQSGPPPMPNWMPPGPIQVGTAGTAPNWTCTDPADAAVTSDIVNDCEVTANVVAAGGNLTIAGHVYAPTGTTGIQNVEVFAYSPMGGMGSHASTNANGAFSLPVTNGSYQVGAYIMGMPPSQTVPVEVKTVGGTTTIYANGITTTDVIIRIQNPETMYTISGKVSDGTNVVKDASVRARRTDGPGNVGTKTDSMGKYILYVQAGTWAVGTFLPQYGNLAEQTVTVPPAKADLDFAPAVTTTFFTVQERAFEDVNNDGNYDAGTDTTIANAHIDFESLTGYHNSAVTDSQGIYTINLPAGTYTQTAWDPNTGKMPAQTTVVTGNIALDSGLADVPTPDLQTVTINFVDSLGAPVTLRDVYVRMDQLGSADVSNEVSRENVSSLTLQIPGPTGANFQYDLGIEIPGISDEALSVASPTPNIITTNDIDADGRTDIYQVKVEAARTLNVTVPTLYTVSGQATDGTNPLPNTVINIKKAPSGTSINETDEIALTAKTDGNSNYSVQLPASGATPYLFQIDKAGYIDTGISVVVDSAETQNLDATKADKTISGRVTIGSTGVEGAKVYAEELGGGFAMAETNALGDYTLSVPANTNWKISATSDTYQQEFYQDSAGRNAVASMVATNQTGVNITLDTPKTGLADLNNLDLNPSSGATFEHTAAGLELIAPLNAVAASQATYQIEDKEVANVADSPTAKVIGGEGVEIGVFEPSGSSMMPKQNLNGKVTIEKEYTKAELVAAEVDTFQKAEGIKMSYYDESASNWEPVLTNITYLNAQRQPVIPTNTLSNVTYVVYAGTADHLTVFAPTIQNPDGLAPKAPTSIAGSAGNGSVLISWTAPTQNADNTTLVDLLGYEIYRSTSSSGTYVQVNTSDVTGTTTYTDSTATNGTTYYYKVTAADTGGVESVMSAASIGFTPQAPSGGTGAGGGAYTPPDTAAPTGSVSINNNAATTTTLAVTLYLSSADNTSSQSQIQMMVSNNSTFTGATWETFTTSKSWTLPSGDGEKTVYVKYKDAAGNISTAYSDVITLATGQGAITPSVGATAVATSTEGMKTVVEVPANAVVANTTVKIEPATVATITATAPAPVGKTVAAVVQLTASAAGAVVSSFAKAVTVTLTYLDSQIAGLKETTLKLMRWTGAQWEELKNIVVNKETNTITGTTDKFSYFAIVGEKETPVAPVVTPTPATPAAPVTTPAPTVSAPVVKYEPSASLVKLYEVLAGKTITALKLPELREYLGGKEINKNARDLAKEKNAIKLFQKLFDASPQSSRAWNMVRAIAYAPKGAFVLNTKQIKDIQKFLIKENKGPVAKKLAKAGATGRLLSLTKGALQEYFKAAGK